MIEAGYKQTGAGVIPEDWEVRALGDMALLERGKFSARPRNDPKYFGGEFPFIQTGDVKNSNGIITSYSQTLNEEGLKVSKLFPRETLFFTIAANIGDVGFATFDAACPDSLIGITPHRQVHRQWLFHELASRKKLFEGLATQNAQLNINLEKLRPYMLPLPPLAEQRAIAAALGDVDAQIAALDRLIAKKRDIKQAAMQQLLTGRSRLVGFGGLSAEFQQTEIGPIPADWCVVRVKDVASIGTGKRNTQDNIKDGKFPFFVRSQSVVRIDTYSYDCEAVLTAGDGVGTGKVFHYVKGKFDIHQRVYKISDFRDDVSGFFFYLYFRNHFFNRISAMTAKSSVDSVRMEMIADMQVPLPSYEEQVSIATVISDMDAEIAALEARREKTRAIKHGMMQELLTGRTRLV